jgi:hypothetical protein
MLKNILTVCFTCIALINLSLTAETPKKVININCAKKLQPCLQRILQLDEGRELLNQIYQEGPISFITSNHMLSEQFGAFWDTDHRAISLNGERPTGEIIGSMLFEMQNALVSKKFEELDHLAEKGRIDRESYMKGMEYLEYQNSLNAAAIADKGIASGIFPEGAFLPTYSSFEEHYYYQKVGGHSAWFGNMYDEIVHKGQSTL